ncbi:MAG: hypothetical protein QJR09_08100 [Micrococcus sp.]|nr:hypothetical protein [Micrococcus sp.]
MRTQHPVSLDDILDASMSDRYPLRHVTALSQQKPHATVTTEVPADDAVAVFDHLARLGHPASLHMGGLDDDYYQGLAAAGSNGDHLED